MAAFTPWHDTTTYTVANIDYAATTWQRTNTCYFAEQPRSARPIWRDYRDRDRLRLALVGAGTRRELRTVQPRRYLTMATRALHDAARRPLRGAREFAYKRPRKAGLIPA